VFEVRLSRGKFAENGGHWILRKFSIDAIGAINCGGAIHAPFRNHITGANETCRSPFGPNEIAKSL
jgi:hypothetical protein